MQWSTFIYPFMLAGLYGLVYLFLFRLFPVFFNQKKRPFYRRQIYSVITLIALSLLIWLVTRNMADQQLANRLLHAVGGGVLAFFACFLSAKDSQVQVSRLQFFTLAILIVTALGVGNELMEFFLQELTGEVFADSIIDTWLDLASNTIGALVASALLVPLIRQRD